MNINNIKCCLTCEWSYKENTIDNTLEELGYDINDPNLPKIGDCFLSKKCNGKLYCDSYESIYIDDSKDNNIKRRSGKCEKNI